MFTGINVQKNTIRMMAFALLILSLSFSGCIQKVVRVEGGGWNVMSDNKASPSTPSNAGNSSNSGPLQKYNNDHLPKGKPYIVWGETYVPYTSAYGFKEEGIASWYGPGFHGKLTSNGEKYNQNAMTAAHKHLPFGTEVRVLNLDTGKSIDVRINDRGPFKEGRIIDLSKEGAERIGMLDAGTARVHIESINIPKPAGVGPNYTAQLNGTVDSFTGGNGGSGGNSGSGTSIRGGNNAPVDSFTSTDLTDDSSFDNNRNGNNYEGNNSESNKLRNGSYANVAPNPTPNSGSNFENDNQRQPEPDYLYDPNLESEPESEPEPEYQPRAEPESQPTYSFYVQVGAFGVKSNANALRDKIENSGIRVRVSSSDGMNYVQVGPYASEALAREAMKDLKSDFPKMMLVLE